MERLDLTAYANHDNSNAGICREWALCRYFGIERNSHDHQNYMEASDIELADGRNISVKSRDFSLMSGSYCRTCKTFEGIWRKYYRTCHSNTWAYVTEDWQCYLMNKKEFSKFVHLFATTARESMNSKGERLLKIRGRKEGKERLAWLEAQVA